MPSEPTAVASGVSATVYELSTAGLTPDPTITTLVETQPEFTTPIWTYLDQRVSDSADQERARRRSTTNRGLCGAMGKRFGVDPLSLGAIWGIETNYGAVLAQHQADQADHPLAGDAGLSASRPLRGRTSPISSRR